MTNPKSVEELAQEFIKENWGKPFDGDVVIETFKAGHASRDQEMQEKDRRIEELEDQNNKYGGVCIDHLRLKFVVNDQHEQIAQLTEMLRIAEEALLKYAKAGYPFLHSCGSAVGKNALSKIASLRESKVIEGDEE